MSGCTHRFQKTQAVGLSSDPVLRTASGWNTPPAGVEWRSRPVSIHSGVAVPGAADPVRRSRGGNVPLAYVTLGAFPQPQGCLECYLAAVERAEHWGFVLEPVCLNDTRLRGESLGDLLASRGTVGVILGSTRAGAVVPCHIDWPNLTVAAVGRGGRLRPIRHFAVDRSGNARLAVRKILSAGYQRIGLVIPESWDHSDERACSPGYLSERCRIPEPHRIPVLMIGGGKDSAGNLCCGDEVALATWYHRHKPEVILSHKPLVWRALEQMGLSIPRHVAFVDLARTHGGSGSAGVSEDGVRMGAIAAEELITLMLNRRTDRSRAASTTVIQGIWEDGTSLPRRSGF